MNQLAASVANDLAADVIVVTLSATVVRTVFVMTIAAVAFLDRFEIARRIRRIEFNK